HGPAIAATEGLSLDVVVTGNAGRAAAARERHPAVRVVASPDQLWGLSDAIDLVVVASPNRTHVPLALSAIDAGLAVVIDKPVAATAADARTIRDAAARRGVSVSVFHNRRYDGSSYTVRELVRSGALGRVHRFEARFDRWLPEVQASAWREGDDPQDAGGLLYDLGSHLIDQALTLFGPVREVYAEVRAVRPGARVDDDVFVALTHVNGTTSHLWASAVAADIGPWLRVLGSAGAYVKDSPDVQEPALRAGAAAPAGEPEYAWGRIGTPDATRPLPTAPGSYADYYAALVAALREKGDLPVTLDEAIAVMVVIEAAQRSALERAVVVV
ncbi:MAG: scyllo-inositol 2-dehydrogenase, partial [Frankiaceae bacterium]|nr:scyllo-inositol 2-dehydrogenase [Frankiaceae bacterium]